MLNYQRVSKCSIHLGVAIAIAPHVAGKASTFGDAASISFLDVKNQWCHGVNIVGTKPWDPPEISWFIVVFQIKIMAKDSDKA